MLSIRDLHSIAEQHAIECWIDGHSLFCVIHYVDVNTHEVETVIHEVLCDSKLYALLGY